MVAEESLDQGRVAAIKISIEIAVRLQTEHPEIARKYLGGMTQGEIVDELGLDQAYKTTRETAKCAVSLALRGYEADHGDPPIEALLSESDRGRERIAKQKLGRSRGISTQKDKKIGVFGQTDEERANFGRKGGDKTFREGTGIFSLSEERKRQIQLNRSRAGVISRGCVPFVEREGPRLGEIEYALELTSNPEFQHEGGPSRGMPNYAVIAKELNTRYHQGKPIRSKGDICKAVYRERRKALSNAG
ncbi:MAG: hypothetical protein KKD18_01975 [Nanoarchaeota archaeon]|nr:hypothetical protein [Nanoarchaeota archaeon]MBU0977159.1 hypothetical protein [Nanoarchaeota archaeon]